MTDVPKPTKGIRIVCTDLETGDTDERTIADDVCVIVAGTAHIANVEDYPAKGTQVYTIKGRGGRG
jgi:hypothetical protein